MGIFSVTQCIGVTQLVSIFFSKGIGLCVAVHSVHLLEEEKSEASYSVSFLRPLNSVFFTFN